MDLKTAFIMACETDGISVSTLRELGCPVDVVETLETEFGFIRDGDYLRPQWWQVIVVRLGSIEEVFKAYGQKQ